jgi:polysaccharide chain length determinant protein (PEP-CTERM system associated)
MEEQLEDQSQEGFHLIEYIDLVRRRRWLLLIPLFSVWLLVWVATWFLPSVYRSGTLILVEQPAVPDRLVQTNVTDDLQSRLDSITQQILSRTRLMGIIEQLGLYPKLRARVSPDEVVERMRKDIEIELVRSADKDRLSSFNVYYQSENPRVAQEVTTELTNLFISENLEARRKASENTTNFLESQLTEARQKLSEQEERVRQFKDQHLGELPGQLQTNLQILGGLQSQLQAQEDALNRARQQETYLESLLGQYRTLERTVKSGSGVPSGGLAGIDRELDRLKAQLTDLSARYTDKHPDVRKVREQIEKLEKTRAQVVAKPDSPTDDAAAPTNYSQIKDIAPRLELESQLKANQIEIKNHQNEIKELTAKLADYQNRLGRAPVREQQLADITRDYDQSRANYDSLLSKMNQSEMATNLEKRQQGEHFRVVDAPNLPTKPYSPNRLKLSLMGLFAGLALGAVFTMGAEFTDDRVHSERVLKKMIPVDVIAEIPSLATVDEQSTRRREIWVAVISAAAAMFIIAVGLGITYLRG